MATVESKAELSAALLDIEKWEREQKDIWFWEKLGRLPFMVLDKLTPKFIQEKLGQAVEEVGSYVQTGGKYLISEKSVLACLKAHAHNQRPNETAPDYPLTMEEARELPLAVMNAAAAELAGSRSSMAALQGATTGFGGLFTLAIDIPAVLGLSLKIIQEIAICHGFDPKSKEERIFAVKVMQFSSSDIVGKQAVLEELAAIDTDKGGKQMLSQLQGWREVVTLYRDNFGWKKLFQMIPVAGMLFGAFINRGMLNDVAEAATMLYRKRRVLMRLREGEEN